MEHYLAFGENIHGHDPTKSNSILYVATKDCIKGLDQQWKLLRALGNELVLPFDKDTGLPKPDFNPLMRDLHRALLLWDQLLYVGVADNSRDNVVPFLGAKLARKDHGERRMTKEDLLQGPDDGGVVDDFVLVHFIRN
jgi:hypothetical protein